MISLTADKQIIQKHFTLGELKHALDISRPKFVFISEAAKGNLKVIKSLSYVELIILIDGGVEDNRQISLKHFIAKYVNNNMDIEKFVQQPIKIFDQTAVIFMSSGTTGLPKGGHLCGL